MDIIQQISIPKSSTLHQLTFLIQHQSDLISIAHDRQERTDFFSFCLIRRQSRLQLIECNSAQFICLVQYHKISSEML